MTKNLNVSKDLGFNLGRQSKTFMILMEICIHGKILNILLHFTSTGSSYNSNWVFISGILVQLLPGINVKLVMADGLCLSPGGWISPSYTFQKNNCRKEAGHNNQQLSSGSKIAATLHSWVAELQWCHTGEAVLYL